MGEPGEQGDQGERGEDREADDGDAGGDGEDVAGVVERVADAPAAAARIVGGAGLDPHRDVGEVGAALQVLELGAQAGAVAALCAQLGFDRFALGFGFGRGELVEQAVDPRASSPASRSPVATVGAVMSSVASWRERTSAIAEKAASASPSLALGISRSKRAPASPALPSRMEERRTIPSCGVDRFEDLGRVVGDVGRRGAEDDLGGAFDVAVLGAGGVSGQLALTRAPDRAVEVLEPSADVRARTAADVAAPRTGCRCRPSARARRVRWSGLALLGLRLPGGLRESQSLAVPRSALGAALADRRSTQSRSRSPATARRRREQQRAAARSRAGAQRATPAATASAAGSPRRRARRARRRSRAAASAAALAARRRARSSLERLHRRPPSAWSRLGAAWCRRSTR